jgi:hypothetical protein
VNLIAGFQVDKVLIFVLGSFKSRLDVQVEHFDVRKVWPISFMHG